MNYSHLNRVNDSSGIKLGIVAPDGREGYARARRAVRRRWHPFIFDPGQGLPMFGGPELHGFIERASWVAVNDYEASLLAERTGWSLEQIATQVRALIVTRGAEGSWIFADGQRREVPVAKAARIADPTGCGDAYRAGLIFGLARGLDWPPRDASPRCWPRSSSSITARSRIAAARMNLRSAFRLNLDIHYDV